MWLSAGISTERVTRTDGSITHRKNITSGENDNLQMRTFNLNKYLLAGFAALATFSWSVKEYYDPDKDQHKKRFQNKDR